jgi:cobalt-zinc-cadmium efflux system outer membrane protein
VTTARSIVEEYARGLVPLRENIAKFSQQQYDAMLLGVFQLIQAKQSEFAAYREYIEALRDYWIARSDLERAVGTRLIEAAAGPADHERDSKPAPPPPPHTAPGSEHGGHKH